LTVRNAAVDRWQAADSRAIAWLDYGDDFVAYHRPSGKTHFLNAAGYLLLADVLRHPRSLHEIIEALVGDSAGKTPPIDELEATLERFRELGLVERAP